MKKPTFDNTVNILVKAYFNDTLEHLNCSACAVGNIIADACNFKYVRRKHLCVQWKWKDGQIPKWYDKDNSTDKAVVIDCDQTKATGYSTKELQRIEHAFEGVAYYGPDAMFNGLMAVIDVLADIHGIDLTQKEESKKLFQKV